MLFSEIDDLVLQAIAITICETCKENPCRIFGKFIHDAYNIEAPFYYEVVHSNFLDDDLCRLAEHSIYLVGHYLYACFYSI